MTTLKELTHENHVLAEQQPFTKLLLSGNIPENIYADFLYNQHAIYQSLEALANSRGLLSGLSGLERSQRIVLDFENLPTCKTNIYTSTQKYIQYITTRNLTDNQILAHLYVRHMGDLYGGQMIKRVVPGTTNMYEFENRKELIEALRSKLDVSMAAEANCCFDFAIELFTELANEYNIQ
jgi:heme oxygenase